jgi:hypothetical protein
MRGRNFKLVHERAGQYENRQDEKWDRPETSINLTRRIGPLVTEGVGELWVFSDMFSVWRSFFLNKEAQRGRGKQIAFMLIGERSFFHFDFYSHLPNHKA